MAVLPRPDVNSVLDAAQTQVERNRQRIEKGVDILLAREEPPVGVTPKDVVYSRGTLRLYHYRPMTSDVYRVPVVFVMSLVSKPWILDLTPGQSFIEYMIRQGFDVFMIDWGIPRPEDKRLRFEDYVLDFMPEYKKVGPEGKFGHYLIMLGALGGASVTAKGERFSEYEASVGTGQVHVWFERPQEGWAGAAA